MYDFETLVAELLQSRPELKREELMQRIEDKKRSVGSGYLTDQGALFLVAGELGVSLRKVEASADMRIKDLYIGANDVTVVARLLSIYPVATYKKKDGGAGRYRRLVLFDGTQSVRLTVWEEGIEALGKLALSPDVVVRVANGYVKQGLDGKANLNLGRRGRIELVSDANSSGKLPELSKVSMKVPRLSKEEQFVALECVVKSEPRFSEFVRSDGSEGSLFQFGVEGPQGKETRVVVWSPTAQPALKPGQRILLTNVRARRSSNGEYEIHGDAGSNITSLKLDEKRTLRVASVSQNGPQKVILGLGEDKRVYRLDLGEGLVTPLLGDAILVNPDETSGGRLFCKSPGSIQVVAGDSLPKLEELATKLVEAKTENSQIMVETIALSHGAVEDVNLNDGTTVKKGELVMGDDTGELKLVGWRELSGMVLGIQPGERLRVVGLAPKVTRMGSWVLQLSSNSVIERLRTAG